MPEPEPSSARLLLDAAVALARRPVTARDTLQAASRDVQVAATRVASLAGGLATVAGGLASATRVVLRRPPASPLHVELGEQRRLTIARTRLEDYRRVREAFGGSVNDVVLAVVAGGLRSWLLSRAEPLRPATTLRALVPVSVVDPREARARTHPAAKPETGQVRPLLVDLPVGEPDPVLRLAQLRYAMASHKASGRAVDADRIAGLSGFAPPTLHALGARAAAGLTRRMFSLVVTNVPGPQLPLYAAGARMTEMFPILPLPPGQAVSIALTSYDGGVFYGINGDRDAMRDVAVLSDAISESLAELVAAADTDAVVSAGEHSAGPRPRRPARRTDRR